MKNAPLLPLLLPLLAGILLADVVPPLSPWALLLILLLLLFVLAWLVLFRHTSGRLILVLLLLTAFLFRTQLQIQQYANPLPLGWQQLQVRLLDTPRANIYGYKAVAKVQQIRSEREWQPVQSKLLIRFADSSSASTLCRGDHLQLTARIALPRSPRPGDTFDYPEALRHRNIYYVAICPKSAPHEAHPLQYIHGSPIHALLMLQKRWCRRLESLSLESQSVALAQALLLGNRDHLSPRQQDRFRTAGIAHLLSLSGLHVGLFVALLLAVTKPLGRRRWSRFAILAIQLTALFLYLFLTGNAPATRRATIMFALLLLGRQLHTPPALPNTIAAAAICMLCIDPSLIYDIGFQLSYAAMLAIPMIYQPLWNQLKSRFQSLQASHDDPLPHRSFSFIVNTALFTTVIQLATLPLTLYHFHSFSTYFLLTNLILAPLLPAIMVSALAALCLGTLPLIGPPVLFIYSLFAHGVDWITSSVSSLPYALIAPVVFPLSAALISAALLFIWSLVLSHTGVLVLNPNSHCYRHIPQ